VNLGGMRAFKTSAATRSVEITTWSQSTTAPCRAISYRPEKTNLANDGASLMLGQSSGYVIKFTNGLKIYFPAIPRCIAK
jgi:hypothetical protein